MHDESILMIPAIKCGPTFWAILYFTSPWRYVAAYFCCVHYDDCCDATMQGRLIRTQAWKQTSGDPSGQTQHYSAVTLLYNFMSGSSALLYVVSSVTMARIVEYYK